MSLLLRRNTRNLKLVAIVLLLGAVAWVGLRGMGSSWELRRRLICAGNMKSIGTTLKIYATADRGSLDAPVEWAVTSGLIEPGSAICPSSGLAKPNYIWLPQTPEDFIGDGAVIMYEPKSNHSGEGGNVLFADGHASFVRGAEYDRLIETARETRP